jgi:hypothetical protein
MVHFDGVISIGAIMVWKSDATAFEVHEDDQCVKAAAGICPSLTPA